jgi:hypothetical protein
MSTLPGSYYEPYDSEESVSPRTDRSNISYGSDGSEISDLTDDSGTLSDAEDYRIRTTEDPRYMILKSKSMNIPEKELGKNNPSNQYASYDTKENITTYKDLVYLNPPKKSNTSLFCLRSDSRDATIYPSPMNFKIKLPRVYKNVKKLQLVQIGFPNNSGGVTADSAFTSSFVSFLLKDGVPPCCLSTCVTTTCASLNMNAFGVIEQGRLNASGNPLMVTVGVPDGVYPASVDMGNELTYQANNTPPFNIISYESFRDIFMNTRDIMVLFNEPGDCFCSKTNNKRYGAHSKEQIMNTYYTQQHIDSFIEITEKIAFNAYYFPVLKELIATQRAQPFLNTGGLSYYTVMSAVMGPFEGLDSDLYYTICQLNQNSLDIFRRTQTFELRNVNKYKWIYNDAKRQFTTLHDSLHTSLNNDIQNSYQTITNQELALQGLNPNSFKSLKTESLQYTCIYKHLENNLSSVIGGYHLVSGFKYQGGMNYTTDQAQPPDDQVQSSVDQAQPPLVQAQPPLVQAQPPLVQAQPPLVQSFTDLETDTDFTSMFCYKSTIGRIYGNYAGKSMNFSTFSDYYSTLSSYYTAVQSTQQAISAINRSIQDQHYDYISNKYASILPQSMLDNRSYMANQGLPVQFITNRRLYVPGQNVFVTPKSNAAAASTVKPISNMIATPEITTFTNITNSDGTSVVVGAAPALTSTVSDGCNSTCNCFDTTRGLPCCKYCNLETDCNCTNICCGEIDKIITTWYGCIPVNTIIQTAAYRLGILDIAPTINITSTINSILPPFNNNLFMSINDEMGFNNLDVGMPEDYSVNGNETTGQVKLMFAKIMFSGIGRSGESQTLFQNPLTFETPLGKLDHLSFKIYYDDAALTPVWLSSPFPQLVNEWNATINIEEEIGNANRATGWGPNPTVPVPTNPNATPFLEFTSKDNPNNAK